MNSQQCLPAAGGWLERVVAAAAACKQGSLAPVWCVLATLLVAASWLLPNHTYPWTSFHADAWMAVALALIAGVVLARTRTLALSALDGVVLSMASLPLLHFAAGLVPFAGQAWVSTAYLVGLLLAMLIGRQWQAWRPMAMGDVLFGSFLIASVISVGLQLYQWASLADDRGVYDIWVIGLAQTRPYGNLGQPNQMATVLLWGLIASGWALYRGVLGRIGGTLVAVWLVLGLALTESRTGFLGLCAVVAATWYWRKLWRDRKMAWYVTALIPVYFAAVAAMQRGASGLLLDRASSVIGRSVSEVRPALWSMIVDAITEHPWFGYGWNQVLSAHLTVAERHPQVPALFGNAHNAVLDVIVWAGIPIGLAVTAAAAVWLWAALSRIAAAPQALYFLVIVVVGLHAMLELPLQYAYCLLPMGLAVGALSADLRIGWTLPPTRTAWRATVVLLAAAAILLALIVRDYFHVEARTTEVRLKLARVHMEVPPPPPDVAVLTQFRSILDLALMEPATGVNEEHLQRARDVATLVISYRNLSQLPVLLALNGHVAEAKCWMGKAMTLVAPDSRADLLSDWRDYQLRYPQLAGIAWTPGANTGTACEAVRRSRLGPSPQLR
jgi:O-antigen ligase